MSTTIVAGKSPAVRTSHRKAAESYLDTVSGPFRRGGISKVLYPLTSPRSHPTADLLADIIMREFAKAGSIQRHGHLHWVKVTKERKLLSGRTVPELETSMTLKLETRAPAKWVSVDLSTGEAWLGSQAGWRKATPLERKEVVECLGK